MIAAVWSTAPDRGRRLPGPLPVHVPAEPRRARGHRQPGLVHGHRRLGPLRRAGGEGPDRGRRPPRRCAPSPAPRPGVEMRDDSDTVEHFDGVVLATHPHQALRHADRPRRATEQRRARARSATPSTRPCCTPTRRVLPRAPRAQASWNYALPSCAAVPTAVQVSYNMNRLQRLDAPQTYVVTLNGEDRIDPAAVIDRMDYEHPVYTTTRWRPASGCPSSTTAWSPSPARTTAGASTRTAAGPASTPRRRWGCDGESGSRTPALYEVDIAHVRAEPVRHDVRHRSYLWFVDLDDLPAHGAARPLRGPRPPRRPGPLAARERRRLPGRERHRPARRADHDARPTPAASATSSTR